MPRESSTAHTNLEMDPQTLDESDSGTGRGTPHTTDESEVVKYEKRLQQDVSDGANLVNVDRPVLEEEPQEGKQTQKSRIKLDDDDYDSECDGEAETLVGPGTVDLDVYSTYVSQPNKALEAKAMRCAREDEIQQYLFGSMTQIEFEKWNQHFLHCDICSQQMLRLLGGGESADPIADTIRQTNIDSRVEADRRRKSRKTYRVLVSDEGFVSTQTQIVLGAFICILMGWLLPSPLIVQSNKPQVSNKSGAIVAVVPQESQKPVAPNVQNQMVTPTSAFDAFESQLLTEANKLSLRSVATYEDTKAVQLGWQKFLQKAKGTTFEHFAVGKLQDIDLVIDRLAKEELKELTKQFVTIESEDKSAVVQLAEIDEFSRKYPGIFVPQLQRLRVLTLRHGNYSAFKPLGSEFIHLFEEKLEQRGLKVLNMTQIERHTNSYRFMRAGLSVLEVEFQVPKNCDYVICEPVMVVAIIGDTAEAYTTLEVNSQVVYGHWTPLNSNWCVYRRDITKFCKPGKNTLKIRLDPDAFNQMWLNRLSIKYFSSK